MSACRVLGIPSGSDAATPDTAADDERTVLRAIDGRIALPRGHAVKYFYWRR